MGGGVLDDLLRKLLLVIVPQSMYDDCCLLSQIWGVYARTKSCSVLVLYSPPPSHPLNSKKILAPEVGCPPQPVSRYVAPGLLIMLVFKANYLIYLRLHGNLTAKHAAQKTNFNTWNSYENLIFSSVSSSWFPPQHPVIRETQRVSCACGAKSASRPNE